MSRLFSCSTQAIDAINKQLKVAFLIEIDFQEFVCLKNNVQELTWIFHFQYSPVRIWISVLLLFCICPFAITVMSTPFSFSHFDWGRHKQINDFYLRSWKVRFLRPKKRVWKTHLAGLGRWTLPSPPLVGLTLKIVFCCFPKQVDSKLKPIKFS